MFPNPIVLPTAVPIKGIFRVSPHRPKSVIAPFAFGVHLNLLGLFSE